MGMQNCRKVYGETLVELGRENERIVALDADLSKSTMTRFFEQEFPEDDETCFLVAGDQAYNSDVITDKVRQCFPAPIKKKLFILDTDAYTQGLIEMSDIPAKLEKFHEAIGNLFEQVITNGLREKMGVIDAD